MITLNGATWTDPQETTDAACMFRFEHGDDVAKPVCHRCQKQTSYMVEESAIYERVEYAKGVRPASIYPKVPISMSARPKRKGVGVLVGIMDGSTPAKMRMLRYEGALYIPVGICNRCSAAAAGFDCAKFYPHQKAAELERVSKAPLTMKEQEEFRSVFQASFNSTRGKIDEAKAAKSGNKSKYLPKKEGTVTV